MRNIVNKKKPSKKRFEALFKGIPIPTYSWKMRENDLILTDYNDAADKVTKGMIKNFIGRKASEMYKNQPEILEELHRCANEHVNIFREMKYDYMSTGEEKFLSVIYGFIPPDLVIVHTEDITEKKKVLERLKKSESELKTLTLKLEQKISLSEEKYRTIFENTGTATVIIEEDTTISLVNEQFEELSGYSKEEIEWKKSWTEFVIEEDLERMKKLHYSRRKDPESTQKKYEFRFVNKENDIRDILIVIDMIPGTKRSIASLLDITERKKKEETIKKEVEKSKNYLNIAGVIIVALDTEGNITLLNKKGHDILQYNEGELIGKNWFKTCLPEESRLKTSQTFNKLMQGQFEPVEFFENPILTKNGNEKIIAWHNSLLFDSSGNAIGTLSSGEDITERRKMMEELRIKNIVFIASLSAQSTADLNGIIDHVNPAFLELWGYKTNEVAIGNSVASFFANPDDSVPVLKALTEKGKWEGEFLAKRYDGSTFISHGSASTIHNENGDLIGFQSANLDVTKQKQAERELQLERDNLLNILNSMEDGVYIVDSNYNIEYVNPILIKEFGSFEGMKCFEYFHDRNEICPWCKSKEIAQGKSARWEWYSFKNQKTYDLIDTPVKNPDGSISKLEIFRDITDSKKAEEELKESEKKFREAYNRAELYKDLFAHDINNILQSILSGIQISQIILEDPEKLDTLKINAQIIKEQIIRGAKLVSNVRKLSQLESPKRNLEKIEILNVLKKVISIVKKSYKDRNLNIRIDSVVEKFFIKTNDFLEDVFENLLINAIKHNNNLITKLIVKILKEQQNGINYVRMEFQDNGIGVADSMKQRIFTRAHNKEEIYLGMGLGLSLVRGIIENYDGKIWVEDIVNGDRSKGSNFVVLIPEGD